MTNIRTNLLGGRRRRTMRTRVLATLAMLGSAVVAVALDDATAAPVVEPPNVGIVCTDGDTAGAQQRIFNLTTRTGYISLPDGNTAFMWGYSSGFDGFQHPGPVLCATVGDTITVVLHNTLAVPTSIAFPGQTGVLADGSPETTETTGGGGGGAITSVAATAVPAGGTVTYSFVADHAGTFLYESGTDSKVQVRMGLFGALIVRPATTGAQAYASADSAFTENEEFMVLLSEIDPYLNQAVERGKNFNMAKYHPRYWLVNGRGFPDSIADNGASWLPTQPYGALAQVNEFGVDHPLPGLARYLNVGTEDFPFHPHGNNGLVIGRDGQELKGTGGEDLSFEKFAINIGPGQTWDVLFKWRNAEDYSPSNPVPQGVPDLANSVIGTFYSGSPYLGTREVLPPGTPSLNQCGEFYIISHNHALFQITSWGANMTGPITYMRIDPPTPNDC